ncbi:hypothetical protein DPMN_044014 [Dreissena polymorpha]|uniref:Uncharacterized protein n=1 Tax=Dreissena polymorpha TaxID=45954 RepID=A0A9D4D3U1_DREPO|nr:hypothetical protein DPMN_044014 [Dreissena polymorpha]
MSDRASNEKAADRLLDEWRDEVLEMTTESDKMKVKHFHCMAHVLLGFHKYSCEDVKNFENKMVESDGPLGRDSLSQFKSWRKTGTVVERVVRMVSETFGPAGDHLGLRDRWEAHCSKNGNRQIFSLF